MLSRALNVFSHRLKCRLRRSDRHGFYAVVKLSVRKSKNGSRRRKKGMTTTRTSVKKVDDMGLGDSEVHVLKSVL